MRYDVIKKFHESITFQIFTVFTVLICSVSASFSSLSVFYHKKELMANLQENGESLTASLAYSCRIGVFTENIGFLRAPLEGAFQKDDVVEVSVFNNVGKLLLQKNGNIKGVGKGRPVDPPSLIVADFSKESLITSPVRCRDDNDQILFWSPVMPDSDFGGMTPLLEGSINRPGKDLPLGFIRVTLSKALVKNQLTAILWNEFFICFCFLLFGTLITYFLARRITWPLKRLAQGVIISGKEGKLQELPVETGNEIGKLTVAFNQMFVSLKAHLAREIEYAKALTHARNLAVLGTTAGKVTHEVGNLVNNIGLAVLLLKKEVLSDRGRSALEILQKESDRIQEFTRNFLQFAKKPALHLEKKTIEALLADLKMVHQSSPALKNIRIDLDCAGPLPPILADHRLLYQAMNNLVKNSIEAIGDSGGSITIHAGTENDSLILSVADTGAGMTDETRARLFEPFFTTKGRNGSGLGMTITQSIVDAHNGRIECHSEAGRGTKFIIQLPLR
jgi:signal transduction histidine kinase